MDADEVVLPRHLLFLLRSVDAMLCRHREAVEPMEARQLGGSLHRHRHHASARAQRMDTL